MWNPRGVLGPRPQQKGPHAIEHSSPRSPVEKLSIEQFEVIAPVDHFAGQGEWAEAQGVLAVVEVTSRDSDTNARDRVEKAHAYAACGIGVYLLVDRDDDSVTVHSEPTGDRYRNIVTLGYGHTAELPGLGITLNIDGLKRYGR